MSNANKWLTLKEFKQESKKEMAKGKSNYSIADLDYNNEGDLLIHDLGPWDKYRTITNDAHNVVFELIEKGHFTKQYGRRLFYRDSDGLIHEMVIRNGKFHGFAPHKRSSGRE